MKNRKRSKATAYLLTASMSIATALSGTSIPAMAGTIYTYNGVSYDADEYGWESYGDFRNWLKENGLLKNSGTTGSRSSSLGDLGSLRSFRSTSDGSDGSGNDSSGSGNTSGSSYTGTAGSSGSGSSGYSAAESTSSGSTDTGSDTVIAGASSIENNIDILLNSFGIDTAAEEAEEIEVPTFEIADTVEDQVSAASEEETAAALKGEGTTQPENEGSTKPDDEGSIQPENEGTVKPENEGTTDPNGGTDSDDDNTDTDDDDSSDDSDEEDGDSDDDDDSEDTDSDADDDDDDSDSSSTTTTTSSTTTTITGRARGMYWWMSPPPPHYNCTSSSSTSDESEEDAGNGTTLLLISPSVLSEMFEEGASAAAYVITASGDTYLHSISADGLTYYIWEDGAVLAAFSLVDANGNSLRISGISLLNSGDLTYLNLTVGTGTATTVAAETAVKQRIRVSYGIDGVAVNGTILETFY